nr:MAG TPA: hypothetical protein [Caudoviricetes sp.]
MCYTHLVQRIKHKVANAVERFNEFNHTCIISQFVQLCNTKSLIC